MTTTEDTNNQETLENRSNNEIDELTAAVSAIHVEDDKQGDDGDNKILETSLVSPSEPPSLELLTLAEWIKSGRAKRILVLSGAGVSVAAGIPDFRTPGTGLYDNLQKYNLPYAEAVFDIGFYSLNPGPFVSLAKELWPGKKHLPTLTHAFLAVLAQKDLLLRNYSQNIDGLEFLAEIPADKLVECHGHFRTASCVRCRKKADIAIVQESIEQGEAPVCVKCKSYVKPDIVFFGEGLPDRFHRLVSQDCKQADLCLVLGTSLQVAPVSRIPDMVHKKCKRVLLNRVCVGDFDLRSPPAEPEVEFDPRDLFHQGDCDDSILQLAGLLGWTEDLLTHHKKVQKSLQTKSSKS